MKSTTQNILHVAISLRTVALILLAMLTVACRKPEAARLEGVKPTAPVIVQRATKVATIAKSTQIASLIDPAKLATLKDRGSNPRILKIVAILYTAKVAGESPVEITNGAIEIIGWGGTDKGKLTAVAILRNLKILEKLGSTTPDDIVDLRKGRSPTVRRGPYVGDIVSVDHIIPRAVCPELDNVIANLELMPLRMNQSKSDSIGDRQWDLAQKLHAAGLLGDSTRLSSAGVNKP